MIPLENKKRRRSKSIRQHSNQDLAVFVSWQLANIKSEEFLDVSVHESEMD